MTGPIQLETAASGKAGAKGMFGAVKRAVAGGSLFMTEYTARGGSGMVAFATKVPGQILNIEVSAEQTYMVHRGGYLCGLPGVNLEIGFQQKFSAGLFGGAGCGRDERRADWRRRAQLRDVARRCIGAVRREWCSCIRDGVLAWARIS
jgi:uncharacterized protein (AIM24 family)